GCSDMTRLIMKLRYGVASICLALLATGCDKFKEGIAAYYAGDFNKAITILEPIAEQAASQDAEVWVNLKNTTLEDALTWVTDQPFQGWQAYAGSLIGLSKVKDGCKAVQTALRPITVHIKRQGSQVVDPRQGNFWQAEVFTLRSWWINLECEKVLA